MRVRVNFNAINNNYKLATFRTPTTEVPLITMRPRVPWAWLCEVAGMGSAAIPVTIRKHIYMDPHARGATCLPLDLDTSDNGHTATVVAHFLARVLLSAAGSNGRIQDRQGTLFPPTGRAETALQAPLRPSLQLMKRLSQIVATWGTPRDAWVCLMAMDATHASAVATVHKQDATWAWLAMDVAPLIDRVPRAVPVLLNAWSKRWPLVQCNAWMVVELLRGWCVRRPWQELDSHVAAFALQVLVKDGFSLRHAAVSLTGWEPFLLQFLLRHGTFEHVKICCLDLFYNGVVQEGNVWHPHNPCYTEDDVPDHVQATREIVVGTLCGVHQIHALLDIFAEDFSALTRTKAFWQDAWTPGILQAIWRDHISGASPLEEDAAQAIYGFSRATNTWRLHSPPASAAAGGQQGKQMEPCIICASADIDMCWVEMPCGHAYHGSCVYTWVTKNSSRTALCPMCRAPISAPPDPVNERSDEFFQEEEFDESQTFLAVLSNMLSSPPPPSPSIHMVMLGDAPFESLNLLISWPTTLPIGQQHII